MDAVGNRDNTVTDHLFKWFFPEFKIIDSLFLHFGLALRMMMMNKNAFAVLSNNVDDDMTNRRAKNIRPRASRPTPISKEALNNRPRLAYGSLITSLASKPVWKYTTKREDKKEEYETETDNSDYYDYEFDEGPPLVWCIEKDYEY